MEKYIIDTNFFVNLEIKSGFGKNPLEIIYNFSELAQKIKKEKKADFFTTPAIIEELKTFFEDPEKALIPFLTVVSVKSPKMNEINFPAKTTALLVEETRERAYKGLKVSEDIILNTAKKFSSSTFLNNIDFQKKVGEEIKNLRDRYRNATRVNFLDSINDFELIVLSKEIDGFLVTADEGLLKWARLFAVKEISAKILKNKLESL